MKMQTLNGVGDLDPLTLLPTAAKLLTSGGSGSGGAAGGAGITVSPTISAQVSPQISPIFQQQFQPSNSPISAGASQYMPTAQGTVPGSIPGTSPFPDAVSASGLPVSLPSTASVVPSTIFGVQTKYVILGVAVIAAVLIMQKRKRGGASRKVDLEV